MRSIQISNVLLKEVLLLTQLPERFRAIGAIIKLQVSHHEMMAKDSGINQTDPIGRKLTEEFAPF